jgi:hypothetical protein
MKSFSLEVGHGCPTLLAGVVPTWVAADRCRHFDGRPPIALAESEL